MSAEPRQARERWFPLATLLAGGCLAAAMAASAWHLLPEARANAAAMQALVQVRDWQAPRAKPPDTQAWLQTRAALAQALKLVPTNADLNEAMGYLYLLALRQPDLNPRVKAPYLGQALMHSKLATAARPMVPSAWANAALALHQLAAMETVPERAKEQREALWFAFDRALAFGQRSQGVQLGMGSVAFSRWAELAPARRQAVQAMLANASPGQQRDLLALASAFGVDLAR
jgi:hypothetical protein